MFISVVAVISQAVGNANRSMERQPSLRTRDTLRRPRLRLLRACRLRLRRGVGARRTAACCASGRLPYDAFISFSCSRRRRSCASCRRARAWCQRAWTQLAASGSMHIDSPTNMTRVCQIGCSNGLGGAGSAGSQCSAHSLSCHLLITELAIPVASMPATTSTLLASTFSSLIVGCCYRAPVRNAAITISFCSAADAGHVPPSPCSSPPVFALLIGQATDGVAGERRVGGRSAAPADLL